MSIGNLHGLVRGAINSVNPDIPIVLLVSTGNTIGPSGKSTPSYAAAQNMRGQVQAVRGSDLKKYSFLQANGIYRAVYLYGNPDAINRLASKGGDLLQFPQYPKGPVCTWLITVVDEPWTASNGGLAWSRVIATLQLDPNNPVSQV
jgi:hypothetical protein